MDGYKKLIRLSPWSSILPGQEAPSIDKKLPLWTRSSLYGQEAPSMDRKLPLWTRSSLHGQEAPSKSEEYSTNKEKNTQNG